MQRYMIFLIVLAIVLFILANSFFIMNGLKLLGVLLFVAAIFWIVSKTKSSK